jgi:phage-related protein
MVSIYYRRSDGSEPASDFIESLPEEHKDAIDWKIELLNDLLTTDPPLAHPHSSQVRGQLRELRCHFGDIQYRVLYQRSDDFFILLHAFRKVTKTLPESEIKAAQDNWDDFTTRMNADPRVRPRAMGHDAP